MENTSLVVLSRQIALQRKLQVVADNVANLNTNGFKRQSLGFEEALMPRAKENLFARGDRAGSFVSEMATLTDFTEGTIEQTGGTFDIALDGEAFFAVQTPQGERYTRAGNFQLDPNGRLVTPDGDPVLGEGGEIVFGRNERDITFGVDGTVSSSAGEKGRLRLVAFADKTQLLKDGANFFDTQVPPTPATEVRVRQGALEASNISAVTEMTRMIEVTRSYEQISNLIKQHSDLRSRAIERLGSLQS
jgi:flagellar basal-body rod protein FlgF